MRGTSCSTGETFDSSCKINNSTLPPSRNCLWEHIKKVKYQIGIWKRSHISKSYYPAPTDGHGLHIVDDAI